LRSIRFIRVPFISLIINLQQVYCKKGFIKITKYDVNLVEGIFRFEIESNPKIFVEKGHFFFVYPDEWNHL